MNNTLSSSIEATRILKASEMEKALNRLIHHQQKQMANNLFGSINPELLFTLKVSAFEQGQMSEKEFILSCRHTKIDNFRIMKVIRDRCNGKT